MAAVALLKFVQGVTVGVNGQALIVAPGVAVVISNSDNTGVKSWQIDLAFVDPASSISPSTPFAFADDSSTPLASIIPDVRGSYRFILKVWDSKNRVGTPTDVDIRNIAIPELHGLIAVPTQIWPLPLPDPASGLVNAKPNELNFGGQLNGFAGDGHTDGLMNRLIRKVDAFDGGFQVVGVPNDADQVVWDAATGHWVPASRNVFTITGFAAAVSLVEVGSSAVNPVFTAALSAALAAGDTAVLTNTANAEAKNVFSTPNNFASSQTYAFTAPNQSVGFTYSVKKVGNPLATRAASVSSAQRSYAGVVAAGASPATLVAAAVVSALNTGRAFSFTLTDDGTHKGQFMYPTRYGTPATVKDRATGFGIAYTLLSTASRTNAFGFAENFNQYEFVSTFNSTVTVDLT